DLQDPARQRRAAGVQRQALRLEREQGAGGGALPGGGRAAADAVDFRGGGALDGGGVGERLPRVPAARYAGDARAGADGGGAAVAEPGGVSAVVRDGPSPALPMKGRVKGGAWAERFGFGDSPSPTLPMKGRVWGGGWAEGARR